MSNATEVKLIDLSVNTVFKISYEAFYAIYYVIQPRGQSKQAVCLEKDSSDFYNDKFEMTGYYDIELKGFKYAPNLLKEKELYECTNW